MRERGTRGREENWQIPRTLHHHREWMSKVELQVHPSPLCPALRTPHLFGALGSPGAWMKCGQANNCENALFLLQFPRAGLPSRIVKLWRERLCHILRLILYFHFTLYLQSCRAKHGTSQTVLWLSSGSANQMHFCQMWRVAPGGHQVSAGNVFRQARPGRHKYCWWLDSRGHGHITRLTGMGGCDGDERGNHYSSFLTPWLCLHLLGSSRGSVRSQFSVQSLFLLEMTREVSVSYLKC